jgi:two-component system response regulator YesN
MYEIWQNKSMAYRHLCESSLRKILALLLSFYGYQQDEEHSSLLNLRMRLQKAISYIQENAYRHITLGQVAAQVDMSSSYFRHNFTKAMSISFSEYIGLLRISKARDLLIKTDMTVASIVEQIGYSNEYYFYSLFKKQMHMTPNQYRIQYQNLS